MNREQFINRIRAGSNQFSSQSLEQYFKDYNGPFDEDTANEYVRFFQNNPKEIAKNLHQPNPHKEKMLENSMFRINNPL
jgi:uncharacterized membrane protein